MGETNRYQSKQQDHQSLPNRKTQQPSTSTHDTSQPGSNTDRPTLSDSIPETFGRHRLSKLLGEDGVGSVYLGQDMQLRRQMALKVLKFSADTNSFLLERFYRKARAAALRYSNICPVFDVGKFNGQQHGLYRGPPTFGPDELQSARQIAVIAHKRTMSLQETPVI